MFVIELVDLERVFDHRYVPAERIDEDAFAFSPHRGEQRIRRSHLVGWSDVGLD